MAKSLNYVAIPFWIFIFVSVSVADAASAQKQSRREAQANPPSSTAPPSSTPPGSEILQNPLSFLTDRPFNDFDWDLTKVLDRDVNDNFVVSPISVKLAIGMLYMGVDGAASKEIEKVLRINSTIKADVVKKFSEVALSLERSKNNEYDLNVGTKLFIDQSAKVNEDYRKRLLKWYNATVDSIDFKNPAEAIIRINKWCGEITQGKINELINPNEPLIDTAMMLINAIYFRGEWEKQFPVEGTKMETFWAFGHQNVSVPTMHVKNEYLYYNSTDLKFHLLRMPYMGKKYAMYLIAPHDIDGLPTLSKKMTPEGLAKSLKLMKKHNINLSLPKFQFESTSKLVPVLKELQIVELFNPKTNLEKIGSSPGGPLSISNIMQKSGIEVNERGSVAYAATDVHIVSRFGEDIYNLDLNRPFVFLIADEEKDAIIFTGKVLNPAGTQDVVNEGPIDLKNTFESPDSYELTLKNKLYWFDTELLEATAESGEGNTVVSPSSVKTALALLLEGAGGQSARQIIQELRLPGNEEERTKMLKKHQEALRQKSPVITLESETQVFIAESEQLHPHYQQSVKDNFYSDVSHVNFANGDKTAKLINDWVNKITNGLIPTLVNKEDFDATTKLFLANCIYFKGDWESQFDLKHTREDCFYPKPGQCQKSYLMTGEKSVKYQYSKVLEAKVVEIPFKDDRFSMVLMLPDKEDGLQHLLKNLQHHPIPAMLAYMRKASVQLTIPRATIEYSVPLSKTLQELGIKDIFSPLANLSGIFSNQSPIAVKDIIHKAKIEINEKGAKAAAATGVQVVLLSAPMKYQFTATYPFLFFIRDVTLDGFLFEGSIVYPDKVASAADSSTIPPPSPPKNIHYPKLGGSLQSNGRRPISTTSTTSRYQSYLLNRNTPRNEARQLNSNGQSTWNYVVY